MENKANLPKTILVVEDYEDSRILLKYLLEKLGYQVLEANDGWKAVESVKRQVPDLILMDMALPSVDGISATKLIRQFAETAIIGMWAVAGFCLIILVASHPSRFGRFKSIKII